MINPGDFLKETQKPDSHRAYRGCYKKWKEAEITRKNFMQMNSIDLWVECLVQCVKKAKE